MKRLLLGPAILSPLALLGFCSFNTPKLPEVKVPEVVRQIPLDDFNAFPPVKLPDATLAPKAPVVKPALRHTPKPQVKPHAPVGRTYRAPVPRARPHVDQAPVETLPPQQGPICIFPLNMIPNCTPQET